MEWILFVLASYHIELDQDKLKGLIDVFSFPEIESITEKYSHGMNKKLSMIISLMVNPYCLLFDESFAGIDPFVSKKINEYINSIKENKIIIISSHNKDLTENLFDKIIYLKDGIFKIIEQFDDIFMED
jgi:ABC-2 type transport system ATP-binding protein